MGRCALPSSLPAVPRIETVCGLNEGKGGLGQSVIQPDHQVPYRLVASDPLQAVRHVANRRSAKIETPI
jgi:hypothetical protein